MREIVYFDASNEEHREAYYSFVINSGWGKSKIMFKNSQPYGNLLASIERELLEYYSKKEFSPTAHLGIPDQS